MNAMAGSLRWAATLQASSAHQVIDKCRVGKLYQLNGFAILKLPKVQKVGRDSSVLGNEPQFYSRVDGGSVAVDDERHEVPLNKLK